MGVILHKDAGNIMGVVLHKDAGNIILIKIETERTLIFKIKKKQLIFRRNIIRCAAWRI